MKHTIPNGNESEKRQFELCSLNYRIEICLRLIKAFLSLVESTTDLGPLKQVEILKAVIQEQKKKCYFFKKRLVSYRLFELSQ